MDITTLKDSCIVWSALVISDLCNPLDFSPPSSSVHGVLQGRILERIALTSSRGSSQPRDLAHISYVSCIGRQFFLPLVPPGKPSRPYRKDKFKSQNHRAEDNLPVPPWPQGKSDNLPCHSPVLAGSLLLVHLFTEVAALALKQKTQTFISRSLKG